MIDLLGISTASATVPFGVYDILIDLLTPPLLIFTSSPGNAFAIPIPFECSLLGVPIYTQAAELDVAGTIGLTNALDLSLGAF